MHSFIGCTELTEFTLVNASIVTSCRRQRVEILCIMENIWQTKISGRNPKNKIFTALDADSLVYKISIHLRDQRFCVRFSHAGSWMWTADESHSRDKRQPSAPRFLLVVLFRLFHDLKETCIFNGLWFMHSVEITWYSDKVVKILDVSRSIMRTG